jgi:hypothetical protein
MLSQQEFVLLAKLVKDMGRVADALEAIQQNVEIHTAKLVADALNEAMRKQPPPPMDPPNYENN